MKSVKEKEQKQQDIPFTEEEMFRFKKIEEKKEKTSFEIAFTGHFSSGKSTIINNLLGASILPTSPVPTSANIIKIKNGNLGLSIKKSDGEHSWSGEIPWDKVRKWGMNGEEISNLTITAPLSFLGNSCMLDTPGVDSTDESHEMMTVEQLYSTDVIVYVMDYNHVQSETNLYFLKQLSSEKKPIYIIVNQVDKHNEEEITLPKFKESMVHLFHQWDIHFQKVFFTSMKNSNHPLNEYSRFERELKALLYNGKDLLEPSQLQLEKGFYITVKNRMYVDERDEIEQIELNMKENNIDATLLQKQQELLVNYNNLQNYESEIRQSFERELGSLFKNVTLFPYTTTELTRNWLESIQPNFKVGLLFTKKKTEEEQEKRLHSLIHELQQKVNTQLLFHVQSFFNKIDRSELSNKTELEQAITNMTFEVTADWLKTRVNANFASRDYVFTFTKEITESIAKDIRKKASKIVTIQINGMRSYVDKQIKKMEEKLETLNIVEKYREEMQNVSSKYKKFRDDLDIIISQYPPDQYFEEQLKVTEKKDYVDTKNSVLNDVVVESESVIQTDFTIQEKKKKATFNEEEIVSLLKKYEAILYENKGSSILSEERNQFIQRMKRYKEKSFVISLFGAFSAGKSSFANALLGENILPVSPNPTTATINTVEKSTETYSHGTVVVTVKAADLLNKEIISVANQIDESVTMDNINKYKPDVKKYRSSIQKTNVQYLLTLKQSLDETNWILGKTFTVSIQELRDLVEETKACLIEKINIYYDCPITEKGVVLVDTPGVNSIHGRHTNVAFQQLRSSDAIFYLTYYNHAFSKADQYFLQQMGKVNESFQNDKLYFIINAADLANSEGELRGVKKHVYDQLQKNGVTNPRLFHLSSKQGLEEKQVNNNTTDSSFSYFEKTFYEQTIMELKELSAVLLTQQMKEYVEKLQDSISFMNEATEEQTKKHEKLISTVAAESKKVGDLSLSFVKRDSQREFEQMLTYLVERMKFVFNDYFSSAINVATLTSNSKKELFEQFKSGINEWKIQGEQFFKQEFDATCIRLEENMRKTIAVWIETEAKEIKKSLPFISYDRNIDIPVISVDVTNVSFLISIDNYKNKVKSKKDLFENRTVKEIKEEIIVEILESATNQIEELSMQMIEKLSESFVLLQSTLKDKLLTAISNEKTRFEAMLDEKEKKVIEKEYDQLNKILVKQIL
ncbi:dynamin family protein [Evansella sp. AB-rgal1]|uniref:dynamin family protein n=1 Tax=Evansella sp. AB-rgal1 TaxID=3242696 RepID=UPI00359E7485